MMPMPSRARAPMAIQMVGTCSLYAAMASAAMRMTQPRAARLNQFTAVPPAACSAMRVPAAKRTARRHRRADGVAQLALLPLNDVGDDQRVDDQRLDEGETDEHRQSNGRRGARVAGDAFAGCGDGATLSDGARRGGDAEQERRGDETPAHAGLIPAGQRL